MNDKDSKLLWEAYNNTRSEPINELNIPAPNHQSSSTNHPKWPEFSAKYKAIRAKMIDAQKKLPLGLGQQMSPDLENAYKLFTWSNIWGLFGDFLRIGKGDDNNVFDTILKDINAKEERDK